MPVVNEDLLNKDKTYDISYMAEDSCYNIVLKKELQEKKDYIFLDKPTWQVIARDLDSD